mgnify:CR=1 FL=1
MLTLNVSCNELRDKVNSKEKKKGKPIIAILSEINDAMITHMF